jgi:hypothetical protein
MFATHEKGQFQHTQHMQTTTSVESTPVCVKLDNSKMPKMPKMSKMSKNLKNPKSLKQCVHAASTKHQNNPKHAPSPQRWRTSPRPHVAILIQRRTVAVRQTQLYNARGCLCLCSLPALPVLVDCGGIFICLHPQPNFHFFLFFKHHTTWQHRRHIFAAAPQPQLPLWVEKLRN